MELHILTEGTQCLPRGHKLEASDSNVGKRQKQAHHHEKINDGHLKRDGAALIRYERIPMAHQPMTAATKECGALAPSCQ
jgi:hypothetical protein